MSTLPGPVRAALGIVVSTVDNARETVLGLPQKVAGLPVELASQAVQASLKAQQRYATLMTKGDELIGTFRGAPDQPPASATFDDDVATTADRPGGTAFDRVQDLPDADEEAEATAALDALEAVTTGESPATVDAAIDALEGAAEGAAVTGGPTPTPGATLPPGDVTVDADGTEVIGADAPRLSTPREPGTAPRKSARKVAKKAARKQSASTPPAVKKATAPPAKKAAATTARKAARKTARPVGSGPAPRPGADGDDGLRGLEESMAGPLDPNPDDVTGIVDTEAELAGELPDEATLEASVETATETQDVEPPREV